MSHRRIRSVRPAKMPTPHPMRLKDLDVPKFPMVLISDIGGMSTDWLERKSVGMFVEFLIEALQRHSNASLRQKRNRNRAVPWFSFNLTIEHKIAETARRRFQRCTDSEVQRKEYETLFRKLKGGDTQVVDRAKWIH